MPKLNITALILILITLVGCVNDEGMQARRDYNCATQVLENAMWRAKTDPQYRANLSPHEKAILAKYEDEREYARQLEQQSNVILVAPMKTQPKCDTSLMGNYFYGLGVCTR